MFKIAGQYNQSLTLAIYQILMWIYNKRSIWNKKMHLIHNSVWIFPLFLGLAQDLISILPILDCFYIQQPHSSIRIGWTFFCSEQWFQHGVKDFHWNFVFTMIWKGIFIFAQWIPSPQIVLYKRLQCKWTNLIMILAPFLLS